MADLNRARDLTRAANLYNRADTTQRRGDRFIHLGESLHRLTDDLEALDLPDEADPQAVSDIIDRFRKLADSDIRKGKGLHAEADKDIARAREIERELDLPLDTA